VRDYQQELNDGIIAALERGVAPWQKPWNGAAPQVLPYNPTTGNQYRGATVLWLMTVASLMVEV
jgi:antirestriction protein ArdC